MEQGDAMMLLMVVCRRGTEFDSATGLEDPSHLVTVNSKLLVLRQEAKTNQLKMGGGGGVVCWP
jgi:hypothetical protein